MYCEVLRKRYGIIFFFNLFEEEIIVLKKVFIIRLWKIGVIGLKEIF